MTKSCPPNPKAVPEPATWDARLARRLVTPLVGTPVTPNHLTTLRLAIGLAGAWYLSLGEFWLCSLGAALIALSNLVDHTDGELARISGQSSKIGHLYDLACDALVTVLLFLGIGFYVAVHHPSMLVPAQWLGGLAGVAVALIFYLRMRIESMIGKAGTKQASMAGFETEDVLYLLPVITLLNGMTPFLIAAAIGAPLFAVYVAVDYQRVAAKQRRAQASPAKDGNDFQAVR
ncbi:MULTISPECIES: CDP-alcohol phosphatidyltransferase family protein [unclassified Caballeronia]|uniref:CDP-alcohol phosphatidyltransferase family protein n=1 Tax=unclassified Caballeronia TaxID=2646786 RepID=UPI0028558D17|nr:MULTISPECIES: CDP-alcohol phosphatidyltransferase family protein [unclassified Caballeronia]MDR5812717.1 CDP-alcohol phosphatidyltransferase family protein [Caballeronia sp. LZ033]MDR5877338.1 CDP-alcohol phosphatidyltransferase family protein [Caballeronia sp. LZ032]